MLEINTKIYTPSSLSGNEVTLLATTISSSIDDIVRGVGASVDSLSFNVVGVGEE